MFSHAQSRTTNATVRQSDSLEVIGTSRREDARENLDRIVRNDLKALNLTNKIALDCSEWKLRFM